ncbi:MAG: sigma-70 family RNA polymerase sigma factor [Thiohalomonadales bacterium]
MQELKFQLKAAIPGLMRHNLALLGHYIAAETMVQDCIEKALDNHLSWDKNKPIKPWLYAILHQSFLEYEPPSDSSGGVDSSLAEYIMRTDPNLANNQQVHRLMDAVSKLPDEPKEILLLVILGGLEYRQISEIVQLPIPKLMAQLHLARKLLRKYTGDSDDTPIPSTKVSKPDLALVSNSRESIK